MSPRVPEGTVWRRAGVDDPTGDSVDAIEVARLPDGGAVIRPAGDPSADPHVYTAAEWDAFVKGVHNGGFDDPRGPSEPRHRHDRHGPHDDAHPRAAACGERRS